MTGREVVLAIGALATIACGDVEEHKPVAAGPASYSLSNDSAMPASNAGILRVDRQVAGPGGIVKLLVDVLLPQGTDVNTGRATLIHVIDSLSQADTMAGAIQATGFLVQRLQPGQTEAPVEPVMVAQWTPLDTVGVIGRHRTAFFRTNIQVLSAMPGGNRTP